MTDATNPPWLVNPWVAPLQPAFVPNIYGALELVRPPAATPLISLAEAKAWARQPFGLDDGLLTALVDRATTLCEQEISGHRQFLAATYDQPLAGWWEGPLRLPRPPLAQVVSISYYDTGGTLQTLDPTLYIVRTPWRQPGTIERAPNKSFPAIQADRRLPITVRYVAGYVVPFTANSGTDLLTPAGDRVWATANEVVRVSNVGGALPSPLAARTNYFVKAPAGGAFQLAATSGGAAIDLTDVGQGTQYLGEVPVTIRQAIFLVLAGLYANREPQEMSSRDRAVALLDSEGYGSHA